MHPKCQQCNGKCCVGEIEVLPSDVVSDNKIYSREGKMRVKEDGSCVALLDGVCTIYDKRPAICRAFKVNSECCKAFFEGKEHKHLCKTCTLLADIFNNGDDR